MKRLHIEDEELIDLFKSSVKETLSTDFTDNVMRVIEAKQKKRESLSAYAPSKSVAYAVLSLLFLALIAAFFLNKDQLARPVTTYSFSQASIYLNNFLTSPVITIASLALSMAVWALIYIHTKVIASSLDSTDS